MAPNIRMSVRVRVFGFTFETIDVQPSLLHVEINRESQKRPIRDRLI